MSHGTQLRFRHAQPTSKSQQSHDQSKEGFSELSRFFEMKARVGTDCLFVFLYDSRDAVTAVSTAFIAIFTLTLWWATWGLLTHGREIEGPMSLAADHMILRLGFSSFKLTIMGRRQQS